MSNSTYRIVHWEYFTAMIESVTGSHVFNGPAEASKFRHVQHYLH